jgi:fluoride exporter
MALGTAILVAIGSGFGGMARYGLSGAIAQRVSGGFPLGTLLVNVSGALAIGIFFGATGAQWLPFAGPPWHHLLTYGFLGGFTTFSTFSLETLDLFRTGPRWRAVAYVAATVVLSVGAVAVGYYLAGS